MITGRRPGPGRRRPVIVVKGVIKSACPEPDQDRFSYSPGVTESDATGPSPAAFGARDALPHAGQVVRRMLLRWNIVIDAVIRAEGCLSARAAI
jgi:hypothetical protein